MWLATQDVSSGGGLRGWGVHGVCDACATEEIQGMQRQQQQLQEGLTWWHLSASCTVLPKLALSLTPTQSVANFGGCVTAKSVKCHISMCAMLKCIACFENIRIQ
jgi:hypothetical protein